MMRRDVWVAGVAVGLGLAIIAMLVVSGLNQQYSDGGGPRDGDLISVPTAPPVVPDQNGAIACHLALLSGILVLDPNGILTVGDGAGERPLVFWPNGYVGRIAGDHIELLDSRGRVVARTGDGIKAAGGLTTINGREGFGVCPVGIEVEPAAPQIDPAR